MKRILLTVALLLCATLAQASMVLLAVAVPAHQVDDLASNEQILLSAYRKKDGSAVSLDKAWHGIHFLLTGSPYDTTTILGQALLGGRPVGKDQGYGPMRILEPEKVKAIADALSRVSADDLSLRYDPQAMEKAQIYPAVIWVREQQEALRFLLSFYGPLQAFYRKAAENGHAVVLVIV